MSRMPVKSNLDRTFRPSAGMAAGILSSWVRRISARLPETLTGMVAVVVFGALFLHVFRDLLSPEMLAIAPSAIRQATWAGIVLILAGGAVLTRRAMASDLTLGWAFFGRLRGLPDPMVTRTEGAMHLLWAASLGSLTGGTAVMAGHAILDKPASRFAVFATGFLLCALSALWSMRRRPGTHESASSRPAHTTWRLFGLVSSNTNQLRGSAARLAALARWRTGLIMRTPVTWLLAGGWVICMAGVVAASVQKIPLPFVAMFAWLGGWLLSLPMALHAASEARELPFEEAFGITRNEIARAYGLVGMTIAALTGVAPAVASSLTGGHLAIEGLTCFGAGAMAPSLMPFLLWQVDVRRPLVQVLSALFASMFLATAIIAAKAAFLLWPVVLILLAHQQNKRILHEQTVTATVMTGG